MYESVAQESRAAPSGDDKVRKCCPREPCCTLGRRRCTKVLPKRAVLHPRATKMYESVAQESRAAPSGDDKVRKCCPKGAVLHPWTTISMVFVAEGFPSSIRHSALRPWATERRGRVALLCRASPSGAGQSGVIFPESSAPSHAPVVGGVQGVGRMVVRPLYRPLYPAYSFDIWKFLLFLS